MKISTSYFFQALLHVAQPHIREVKRIGHQGHGQQNVHDLLLQNERAQFTWLPPARENAALVEVTQVLTEKFVDINKKTLHG